MLAMEKQSSFSSGHSRRGFRLPIHLRCVVVLRGFLPGVLLPLLLLFALSPATAQPPDDIQAQEPESTVLNPDDERIEERIAGIYSLLEPLNAVAVEVEEGVVLLSGSVSNEAQAERAVSLASQIPGVITVDDSIDRRLDVDGNLSPMIDQIKDEFDYWLRAIPLIGLAILIFIVIVAIGYSLAAWSGLWRRVSPNPFLAELMVQAVRATSILIGLVVTLNLLGATGLLATILGGAGVVGLAIGFAVRDTIENYISSIMLSLRQPFRANDHVIINEHEGKVVRLTSRATILMTLDGNQLRIPNSTVFKAVILNYSRNPERRFEFELGVDANDDPIAAIHAGVNVLSALPFILRDPGPNAIIETVGDSSIVLKFMGWINQTESDFGKARSHAISATISELDNTGFTLPEPIYRLRFDEGKIPQLATGDQSSPSSVDHSDNATDVPKSTDPAGTKSSGVMNVKPDNHLEEMVKVERLAKGESDLLDGDRPEE